MCGRENVLKANVSNIKPVFYILGLEILGIFYFQFPENCAKIHKPYLQYMASHCAYYPINSLLLNILFRKLLLFLFSYSNIWPLNENYANFS